MECLERGKYKFKDCYFNELNEDILKRILEEKFPNETVLLLKKDGSGFLYFNGELINLEKNAKEEAEYILEGIDFQVLSLEEFIKEFEAKGSKKFLLFSFFLLLVAILSLTSLFVFKNLNGNKPIKETNKVVAKEKPKPKVVKIPKPYEKSQAFLRQVLSKKLPLYIFISEIDFDNHTVKYASFVPLENFKLEGNKYVYSEREKISGNFKPFKDTKKCLDFLLKNFQIEEIGKNFYKFKLQGEFTINRLFDYLKAIYGCKAKVSGEIKFSDLLHRKVNLEITLFL